MTFKKTRIIKLLTISITSALPMMAYADFNSDSTVKLNLKNFYLDRDIANTTEDVGSWSQGIDLQYSSGFTDTAIKIGLDASIQSAITLNSEGDDGSLPYNSTTEETTDEYSRGGITLKFNYSKTDVTIGDHRPHLPIAWDDTSRQLDTIFEGAVIKSNEIDKLSLTAGTFWQVVTRQSSDKEDIYLYGTDGEERSDGLIFAGATYDATKDLQATYFYGELQDIYTQQYFGIKNSNYFDNDIKLTTDIRYFDNSNSGERLSGDIDGTALGAKFTVDKSDHSFSISYQKMNSDGYFPTMNGYVPQPYLVNWSSLAFVSPDETSYGVGYGYNFKSLGLPGLNLSARYIKGNDIDYGSDKNATESERDIFVNYTIQEGTFKGVKFDIRNIHANRSYASDYDEFRFITTYTYEI